MPAPLVLFVPHLRGNALQKVIRQQSPSLQPRVEAVSHLLDQAPVLTDPPYNVAIDGHVCGLGSIKHAEFAMASGEMSEAEFTAFLTTVLLNMEAVSLDGALHCIFMDWRHLHELLTAGREVYADLKNLCVWNKDNGLCLLFIPSDAETLAFGAARPARSNSAPRSRRAGRTASW